MSLRSRLAFVFGAIALSVSVLVGLLTYRTTVGELNSATDEFLRGRIAELDDGVRARPGSRRSDGRFDEVARAADDDSIIQVTGPRGVALSTGAALPESDGTGFSDITVDGESYRMLTREVSDGGVVQVARSTAETEEVVRRLVARFSLIALMVAAAAAAIGWFFASRTTSPLRRLAAVANDVARTGDVTVTDQLDSDGRVDEIGSLTDSFRSMLDALAASRSQQHRLIHDAGHELRSPLTSMRANVQMLERAPDLPADQRAEIVTAIGSELGELNDLFDEMIDLATDQESAPMTLEPVRLADIAETVADRWRRRSGHSITVTDNAAARGDSDVVLGDLTMLERATSNLVDNAVKFSPAGAPVEIVLDGPALSVRDSGPGVASVDRPVIFDRFHRSAATRSMPGSGLGLSIVAQIVERHGGTVSVGDAPNGGAEVGFQLSAQPPRPR